MKLAWRSVKRSPAIAVAGKAVRLTASMALAKGGEADIYRLDADTVLKLYKQPAHPDFDGQPDLQQLARLRIDEQQQKLPAFPRGLPDRVVQPLELAKDENGRLAGYTMRFVHDAEVLMRYADRAFRENGICREFVLDVFHDLHATVRAVHAAGVVIGDFNDLNVLVTPAGCCCLVDADSFQYGGFACRLYTERFVDPLLCDPDKPRLTLARPHCAESDWYAYAVMLMQCMTYAGPYSGVYKPGAGASRCTAGERPLRRITVFHPDVKYPRPALPLASLPAELLDYLRQVFEHDLRGEFPVDLLALLRAGRPSAAAASAAAAAGPVAPAAPKVVRGRLTAARLFFTGGRILAAASLHGKPQWLVHEDGTCKREDDRTVFAGQLDPSLSFHLAGARTIACLRDKTGLHAITKLFGDDAVASWTVDMCGAVPALAANSHGAYFVSAGILQHLAPGAVAPRVIGNVLTGQTRLWVGQRFGFGFYRAGSIDVKFVFGAEKGTLNDSAGGFAIRGQLLDADCFFSDEHCWFLYSTQEGERRVNRACLLRRSGECIATAEAEPGDGSWLGTIHGKCALAASLLCSTDDGIVRVEATGPTLAVSRTFPDTEEFVSSDSALLPASGGLLAVGSQEITQLDLS